MMLTCGSDGVRPRALDNRQYALRDDLEDEAQRGKVRAGVLSLRQPKPAARGVPLRGEHGVPTSHDLRGPERRWATVTVHAGQAENVGSRTLVESVECVLTTGGAHGVVLIVWHRVMGFDRLPYSG
jgi:hypothetical protein